MKTWCPKCKDVTDVQVKDYYLLGEKKREDYFCSNCGCEVVLNCSTEKEHKRRRILEKLKNAEISFIFYEIFINPIALILCLFFSIIFWDKIVQFLNKLF